MSSTGTGSGSHFSTGQQGGGSYAHGANPADSVDFGFSSLPGSQPAASDTFAGLPLESPNGSHATPSSSFEPVASRKASPSDTDVFLAVAAQAASQASGASQQSSLTPASSPIPSADAPRHHAAGAGAAAASGAQAQVGHATKSGPVNPLVAARNSGPSVTKGTGNEAQAGLFPIQEVEGGAGRGFDTSFNEKGSKKAVVIVIIVVLVLAAAVVAAFLGMRYKDASDARAKINDAIDQVRATDTVVTSLDTAIATEISGVSSDALSDAMMQSTTVSNSLSSAEQLASEANKSRDLLDEDDAAAIDAVNSSISARRSLLEIGRILSSNDAAYDEGVESLAMVYGCIADATTYLANAETEFAALFGDAGTTSTGDPAIITQYEQQARDSITTAQNWLADARAKFSAVDFTVVDTYLTARANEIDLLIQYDSFMIGGDAASAEALLPQYEEAMAATANAAASLPATAADLLGGVYADSTAGQYDNYTSARAKCVDADTVLNSYLGISNPSKAMGLSKENTALSLPAANQATVADTAATTDDTAAAPAEGEAVAAEGEAVATEGEPAAEPVAEGEAVAEAAV